MPDAVEPYPGTSMTGHPHVRGSQARRAETLATLNRLCRLAPDDPSRRRLRDEVVAGYMPYARYLANRHHLHGEAHLDLVQAAYMGLVKAVDNFDPAYDTAFLTYATPMITGEMKRHFRDTSWDVHVPRRMQELSAQLRIATADLTQSLGRSPTMAEVAEHLRADPGELVEAYEAARAYSAASLDAPVPTGDSGGGAALGELLGSEDPAIDKVVKREALKEAVKQLGERDKRILLLRFFRGMTQAEIGDELGVSQMQVSRILTQILGRLRSRIVR